jgi:predicted house-cleaning noncanonical NTP pyrophosphatase (MazG superfamily)
MRQEHNKLVRDYIPEIASKSGKRCEVKILSESDFIQALKKKLVEEAEEAANSNSSIELIKELADLYEVIDTILLATGIERETLLAQQKQKREERGGFEKRLQLIWTEENAITS